VPALLQRTGQSTFEDAFVALAFANPVVAAGLDAA
jgi:hypothetical protein